MSNCLCSAYGETTFNQRKFTDIFYSYGIFAEYMTNECEIPMEITSGNLKILYYLLYARYGNSTIASSDETQFKYKLASIIFQYGPTWEKRLEIQQKLRDLTDNDILMGAKLINNHAYNPSTAPSTASLEELTKIDQQGVTTTKKSKLDGYNNLLALLETDVTEQFIKRFQKLFIQFVYPGVQLLYENNV